MAIDKCKLENYFSKSIEWLIYMSIVLIPIMFLPQFNSVFTTPKLYIFRVITLIIILLWGLRNLCREDVKIRFVPFFWFVIGYAAISVVNTIVSVSFFTSMFGTYGRFMGIFTVINLLLWSYIIFCELKTREKIINLLWVSVITSLVVAVYGLLQYFDLFVNIIPWTQNPQDRMFSTIGHSNHTAAYLGMNLMLIISLIFNQKKGGYKNFLIIALVVVALALVFTASRGGIFAVLIALMCWLVFILKRKKLSKKGIKYTVIGLIITSILGVMLSGPISKIGVVERTVSTIEFMAQGNVPDRLSWWMSSLEMINDKPLLGHGLSTYKDIFNKYRRVDYRVPNDVQDTITPETAHNEYLNILATQGIIGFILYASMITMLFIAIRRFIKKAETQKDRVLIFGIFAALLVQLIQVLMSFGSVTTLFMFYTFAGIAIAYTDIENQSFIKFKNNISFKIVALILSLILFAVGMLFAFNSLSADYQFKQASVFASQRDYQNALMSYEKAIEIEEHISKYHEGYGNFLFTLGGKMPDAAQAPYLNDAISKYDEYINLNPHSPNIYANKALIFSKLAKLDNNNLNIYLTEINKASELMEVNLRNNPFYHYKFGEIYFSHGIAERARYHFEKVLEIRSPYKDTQNRLSQLSSAS